MVFSLLLIYDSTNSEVQSVKWSNFHLPLNLYTDDLTYIWVVLYELQLINLNTMD